MSAIGFPSHNQVSIIGRIAQEPTFGGEGRVRTVTLGVETDDEGGARIHRIKIQDEFLAKAMHERLVMGAIVHVLGELDYDDDGCHVAITQRRGSDVNVLAGGGAHQGAKAAPGPGASVARQAVQQPPARPMAAVTPPPVASRPAEPERAPVSEPVDEPGADAEEAAPEAIESAQPASHSPAPAINPPPPARRPLPAPTPAFSMPRPVPPSPARPAATPAAGSGGSVLGGLKPSSAATHSDDAFPGDMPSKLPNGLGAPRPAPTRAVGTPGGRTPTGPDSFDDDIPF